MSDDVRFRVTFVLVSVVALVAGIITASWVVGAAIAGVLAFLVAYREITRREQHREGG